MSVGDIGHWRDSAGGQVPGATFAGFNFASQQRNDNSTYSKPDDSTIEFEEAGLFLIKWQLIGNSTTNARCTPQTRIAQTVGSGDFFTTYYSGFCRNNNNDDWGLWGYAFINAAINDRAQIQWRRDTDTVAGGSTINASDVQVVKIGDDGDVDYAIYNSTTSGNAFGGETPNDVTWQTIVAETNTASIQRAVDQTNIDLKRDNARYLMCYGMASDDGEATRTQRVSRAVSGSTLIDGSVSYLYQRDANNGITGLGCRFLHEVGTTDEALSIQVYRGEGVGAGEGGADTDAAWTNNSGEETALLVIDLPDQVEAYAAVDGTAAQDISGGVTTTINSNRTVNFNDAASFTRVDNTQMDCTVAMDVDVWCNLFTAREDVGATTRLEAGARIEIDGTDQTVGVDRTYTRGSAGNAGTWGGSWHPGGYFSVTSGQNIECETFDIGDDGGQDTTRVNEVGFFAINLDTWEQLGGAIEGQGDTAFGGTAALLARGSLLGQGDLVLSGTALLVGEGELTGQGDMVFGGAAAGIARGELAGAGAVVFDGAAVLAGVGTLAGQSNLVFNGNAAVGGDGILAGQADLVFDGTANALSIGALSGQGDVQFDGTAVLIAEGRLEGVGSVVFGGVSLLGGDGDLAGQAALVLDGNADLQGDGALSGQGVMLFDGVASLSGEGQLEGQGDVVFDGAAFLAGDGILLGQGDLVFDGAAALSGLGSGALTGQGDLVFDGAAIASGGGQLEGQGVLVFDGDAVLQAPGELVGQGSILFDGTADLLAFGQMSGQGLLVLDGAAAITGDGILAGQANLVFDGAGVLSGLGGGALSGLGSLVFGGLSALTQPQALLDRLADPTTRRDRGKRTALQYWYRRHLEEQKELREYLQEPQVETDQPEQPQKVVVPPVDVGEFNNYLATTARSEASTDDEIKDLLETVRLLEVRVPFLVTGDMEEVRDDVLADLQALSDRAAASRAIMAANKAKIEEAIMLFFYSS